MFRRCKCGADVWHASRDDCHMGWCSKCRADRVERILLFRASFRASRSADRPVSLSVPPQTDPAAVMQDVAGSFLPGGLITD
jgi:hypothetical protein